MVLNLALLSEFKLISLGPVYKSLFNIDEIKGADNNT
jgi:hypothetical protein